MGELDWQVKQNWPTQHGATHRTKAWTQHQKLYVWQWSRNNHDETTTDRGRQGIFIQEGRGAQVRTINGRTDKIQVKIRSQKRWENRNRKQSLENTRGEETFKIKPKTLKQTKTIAFYFHQYSSNYYSARILKGKKCFRIKLNVRLLEDDSQGVFQWRCFPIKPCRQALA